MPEHEDANPILREARPTAEPEQEINRPQAWLTGIGLGVLVLSAMVIAFLIGTNYSDDPAPAPATAGEEAPALPKDLAGPGRDLFVATCGGCHELADAGTSGQVGPNLDELAPDQTVVEQAIANGGAGSGTMPPGLLSGGDVTEVSEYIVAATGGN